MTSELRPLAIMVVTAVVLTACVRAPMVSSSVDGPTVNCVEVPDSICLRATSTARSLSPYPWADLRLVSVHWGRCAIWEFCPVGAAQTDDAITVELHVAEGGTDAFITIERENGDWSAVCYLWILEKDSGHTEPC
jgi:hypothetical protein